MSKKKDYSEDGAFWGALAGIAFNLFSQKQRMDENPDERFDLGELVKSAVTGGALGAGVGFVAGAFEDYYNQMEEPINLEAFLKSLIPSLELKPNDPSYQEAARKLHKVKEYIIWHFQTFLSVEPKISGSVARGTALKGVSDIDLFVRFKPGAFSLKEMYSKVVEAMKEFSDPMLIHVREQEKSVGMLFEGKHGQFRIDVVPQRDISDDPSESVGHLFVKGKGILNADTYKRTNIEDHLSKEIPADQREIVVLMKFWRLKFDVPIPSFLLENLVKETFRVNEGRIPKLLDDKLLLVIQFIHDNIETIRLSSVENSANELTDIPPGSKAIIRHECARILEDVRIQPNNLARYFDPE